MHFDRGLDPQRTGRRIRVALGQEPGDLLITGGQLVNVFSRRVEPAEIVIADGRIAGVGRYEWQAKQTLSASGFVILPGLIDAHMHLESTLLLPSELARLIVPDGDHRGDFRLARDGQCFGSARNRDAGRGQ